MQGMEDEDALEEDDEEGGENWHQNTGLDSPVQSVKSNLLFMTLCLLTNSLIDLSVCSLHCYTVLLHFASATNGAQLYNSQQTSQRPYIKIFSAQQATQFISRILFLYGNKMRTTFFLSVIVYNASTTLNIKLLK